MTPSEPAEHGQGAENGRPGSESELDSLAAQYLVEIQRIRQECAAFVSSHTQDEVEQAAKFEGQKALAAMAKANLLRDNLSPHQAERYLRNVPRYLLRKALYSMGAVEEIELFTFDAMAQEWAENEIAHQGKLIRPKLYWKDHWLYTRSEARSDTLGTQWQGVVTLAQGDENHHTARYYARLHPITHAYSAAIEGPVAGGFYSKIDAEVWCEQTLTRLIASKGDTSQWQTGLR